MTHAILQSFACMFRRCRPVSTAFALTLLLLSAAISPIFAAVLNADALDLPAAAPTADAAAAPDPAPAQDSTGDVAGFGRIDTAPPTGISVDELIRRFGARETEFAKARDNYVFRQTVTISTLAEDSNKVDGQYRQVTDISFTPDGRRDEHVVNAPANTLQRILMTPADFDEIEHRLPFILTTPELPEYTITYIGRQKVDDLDTYVFDAAPKTLEKGKHYFQGRVWIDQVDDQIVLVNGKTVPQNLKRGHADLQPPFTTYYEQIDGKYWFPTYTKAEGTLHFPAQQGALDEDIHVRNIVKYTDYKRYRAQGRIIFDGEDITNNKPADPNAKPAPTPPAAQPATSSPAPR